MGAGQTSVFNMTAEERAKRQAHRRYWRQKHLERLSRPSHGSMHQESGKERLCCLQSSGLCHTMGSKHHRRNKTCWLAPAICQHCDNVRRMSLEGLTSPDTPTLDKFMSEQPNIAQSQQWTETMQQERCDSIVEEEQGRRSQAPSPEPGRNDFESERLASSQPARAWWNSPSERS